MNYRVLSRVALACCLLTAAPAAAQEAETPAAVTAGADVTLVSRYLWRGFDSSTGPCLQPEFWVAVRGLRVTSWLSASGEAGGVLREHDLTVQYGWTRGRYDVAGGWTGYLLRDDPVAGWNQSHEFFASATRKGAVSATLMVAHDITLGAGTYVNLGLQRQWPPARRVVVTTTMAAGYNDHQWTERSGMSDLNAGVRASLSLGAVEAAPFVNVSRALDRELSNRVYAGISLSTR